MGIDADRVSRQTEQLRSTDVLVVPESPSRQWGMLLGCVVFTVLSVGLLALANQSVSSLQFMVSGIAGVVFFGVVGIPVVVRKILRRSRLVVTPGGLRLERRSGQSYVVNESARWTDIAEFFGEQISSGGGPRAQCSSRRTGTTAVVGQATAGTDRGDSPATIRAVCAATTA